MGVLGEEHGMTEHMTTQNNEGHDGAPGGLIESVAWHAPKMFAALAVLAMAAIGGARAQASAQSGGIMSDAIAHVLVAAGVRSAVLAWILLAALYTMVAKSKHVNAWDTAKAQMKKAALAVPLAVLISCLPSLFLLMINGSMMRPLLGVAGAALLIWSITQVGHEYSRAQNERLHEVQSDQARQEENWESFQRLRVELGFAPGR